MEIINEYISLSTEGNTDIIDITQEVENLVKRNNVVDGIVTIFVPGATGGVVTMEYEPELIKDTKRMFSTLVEEKKDYYHNKTHFQGNAASHLRATIVGPSLVVPVKDGMLELGQWQQIVFIDFDNRKRNRKLVIKIIGEKRKQ